MKKLMIVLAMLFAVVFVGAQRVSKESDGDNIVWGT